MAEPVNVVFFQNEWNGDRDLVPHIMAREWLHEPGSVNVRTHSGVLEGAERRDFLGDAATADIVIFDRMHTSNRHSCKTMASVAKAVLKINPRAMQFARVSDPLVAVHTYAQPIVGWREREDPTVQTALRMVRKRSQRMATEKYCPMTLLFDPHPLHRLSGMVQLTDHRCIPFVPHSYEQAQRLLSMGHFEVLLADLFVHAPSRLMGRKGWESGREECIGSTLAFWAMACGVKKLGILTDKARATHFGSAAIEAFGNCIHQVGRVVFYFSSQAMVKVDRTTGVLLTDRDSDRPEDTIAYAKDWRGTLVLLMR